MQLTLTYSGTQYQAYGVDELRQAGVPENVISEAVKASELEGILENRKSAYKAEADHLHLEWQYDQTPEKEQAWRDKVAEIKARYPLPE